MAYFNNAITLNGRLMLARAQSGAVLIPTRIVIGSGNIPAGHTPETMTAVVSPVKELTINKKQTMPDGKCIIGCVYNNADITAAFYFRELAVFMRAEYRAEDGTVTQAFEEVLYSYGNAGATADYMPAYSTSTVVEKQIDLVVWVGNEAKVDLTIESGVYVTRDQVAPAGYGLGTAGTYVTERNAITASGFYRLGIDTPDGTDWWGHATAYSANNIELVLVRYNGDKIRSVKSENGWGEWEWINIPLETNVPYRTTERRKGKAVYKMLDSDGVLRYRPDGETAWKTYAQEIGAAPVGFGYGGEHVPVFAGTESELEAIFSSYLATMSTASTRQIAFGCSSGTFAQRGTFMATIYKFTDDYSHIVASIYGGFIVTKSLMNDKWLPFEWVNPPLDVGVEYRTAERYNGKSVYKKVDSNGNILWRAENETSWHLLASASYIAGATVE